MAKLDKELEEFRSIMEVPSTFQEGFSWSSLFGALFVALLMVPGAVYMGLLAGIENIGVASQWVTVILFIEVAKRAHRSLNRAEIFVLFFVAAAAMGVPFYGLLWSQFFKQSDAAASLGIAEQLPRWYAPPLDSESYALRRFLHVDWLQAIGMIIFGTFFGQLAEVILGYGLFRLASDVEKLPFPMAPVGAQGILALAEDVDARKNKDAEASWRWRVFSIGGAIGLAFGTVYLLLPTISGALTKSAIQIFPIPFSDFTLTTGRYLPAVPTGIAWDMGHLIFGMVMPFFGMVGGFIAYVLMFIVNPILYKRGILESWKPGDDTIITIFKNNVDFYFSFQIGLAIAIAIVGIWQVTKALAARRKEARREGSADLALALKAKLRSRGDVRVWFIVFTYLLVTLTYITVSALLLRWHHGTWRPPGNENGIRNIIFILFFLGFIYTPIISYVTARLEGLVGQVVAVPMVREAALILSGYRGVACWFLPIPVADYGWMVVHYRECELTGTKFTSIWKARLVLYPIVLLSSIFFMNFIWSMREVPSAAYPFAEKIWNLEAANRCIMYSSTLGEYSIFERAFNWTYIWAGGAIGVALFGGMSMAGAPIMLTYGLIRGFSYTIPHSMILEFLGALLGRYYFQKRMGLRWRQYVPVVSAGFACGMGLITTVGVGITFLSKAMIQLPF
jgi:hypothetical protein